MSESKNVIFGKEFTVTAEQNAFNDLRTKYLDLSKQAKKELSDWYDENVTEINDLYGKLNKQVEKIIDIYENKAVLDIIDFEIYDIDEVKFDEIALGKAGKLREAYSTTVGKFRKIDAEQASLEAERKETIANAANSYSVSTFVGGDAGVTGMVSAAAESAVDEMALNAVSAGATALLTKGVRHFEKKAAEDEKENIFRSVSTKQDILNGVEDDVFSFHKVIAQIVNDRLDKTVYRFASDDELEMAEPVCRNIIRGNFKNELEERKITEFLTLNPYEFRVYVYLCKKSGSFTPEADSLVSYYKIDREKLADTFAKEKFSLSDCTEYEDAVILEENVRNEIKIFGVEECNFLYEVIDLRDKLHIIRRTFRDYVYDTIEDRDKAEIQYNNFFEEHQNIGDMDIDELFECYAETYPSEIYPKNKAEFRAALLTTVKKYVKAFTDINDVIRYIGKAENMMAAYPEDNDKELVDLLYKAKKRIENKAKFAGFMSTAKDKVTGLVDRNQTAGGLAEKAAGKLNSVESQGAAAMHNFSGNAKEALGGFADKFKKPGQAQSRPSNTQGGRVCPECGTVDSNGGRFCIACGHQF